MKYVVESVKMHTTAFDAIRWHPLASEVGGFHFAQQYCNLHRNTGSTRCVTDVKAPAKSDSACKSISFDRH